MYQFIFKIFSKSISKSRCISLLIFVVAAVSGCSSKVGVEASQQTSQKTISQINAPNGLTFLASKTKPSTHEIIVDTTSTTINSVGNDLVKVSIYDASEINENEKLQVRVKGAEMAGAAFNSVAEAMVPVGTPVTFEITSNGDTKPEQHQLKIMLDESEDNSVSISAGVVENLDSIYLKSVVMSENGEYAVAATDTDVFLYKEQEKHWSEITPSANGNFHVQTVKLSEDGKYIFILALALTDSSMRVYRSNDYGKNWQETTIIDNFTSVPYLINESVDISSDGQYMAVGVTKYGIFISSDFGHSFHEVAITQNILNQPVFSLKISADGSVMLAATSLKGNIDIQNYAFLSTDFGHNWSQINDKLSSITGVAGLPENYSINTVGASLSGERLLLGGSINSTNDMQHILSIVYQSLDKGVTWEMVSELSGIAGAYPYNSIAMTYDEEEIYVGMNYIGGKQEPPTLIYYSNNGGSSYQEFKTPAEMTSISKLVVSDSGNTMVVKAFGRECGENASSCAINYINYFGNEYSMYFPYQSIVDVAVSKDGQSSMVGVLEEVNQIDKPNLLHFNFDCLTNTFGDANCNKAYLVW
ncbi:MULTISPECIES: VPS10 domain-containing protein [Cysteiniphilum]|uniref:VPS10 domain-containing protein n=1 Tax=Cysteiniphilum TaxID=2056696 RepID=UPI00177C889D|nr:MULTISPECIES: sialidase family protein [Cysteiniphilum]